MAIQHKDIPESELHEPKGVSVAAANTVYVATGLGSGSWQKIGSEDIEGLGDQNNTEGLIMISNGQGGFKYVPATAYGSLVINNNSTGFPITAAGDSTLNTNTDYKVLTGTGASWIPDLTHNTAVTSDGVRVLHTGIYRVETWMDIVGFPNNMARLAMKYIVNDNEFSLRKISVKSNSGGDAGSLTGFGLVELAEDDVVRVAVASTHAGNIIFESGNVTITLVRAI